MNSSNMDEKLNALISALPDAIEPSRDLWPDIAARIRAVRKPAQVITLVSAKQVKLPATSTGRRAGSIWSKRPAAIAAALFILVSLSAALTILSKQPGVSEEGWTVTGIAGAPTIGRIGMNREGAIGVGEWIETDGESRAQIEVGNIGQVELQPNSRVRILRAGADEHRMALDRGGINAFILAPPRLFLVETPSALAVDLGCAYELTVDERGNGHLNVTAGWVALEFHGVQSLVPAGAACVSRPGSGPGTPYFLDSAAEFQKALSDVDLGHSLDASLPELLAASRVRDSLSLWHLLPRVARDQRALVWERLTELLPAPPGVTREAVLNLDRPVLDQLKEDLEQFWF
ncbi:MAG: hypothetical protein EHM61_03875 [Acidobacteria bacterium]|nr:MAG: hypothetical protein EHM61_03875 [Acidobacteriota bacterium]